MTAVVGEIRGTTGAYPPNIRTPFSTRVLAAVGDDGSGRGAEGASSRTTRNVIKLYSLDRPRPVYQIEAIPVLIGDGCALPKISSRSHSLPVQAVSGMSIPRTESSRRSSWRFPSLDRKAT